MHSTAMSYLDLVLGALPRIHDACRLRGIRAPSGAVVSRHQAGILRHLDREDPVMVTELAEFVGVTPATMSLNLKRLEAGGFVERRRDPEDRRVVNVRLTDLGVRAREVGRELDPVRVHDLLSRLRPDQRRRVAEGLALLAEAADASVARKGDHVEALSVEDGR